MIQVIETIDAESEGSVRAYLASRAPGSAAATASGGGEHDPAWLHVLAEGLGHRPIMLVVRGDNGSTAVKGYLPLALVATRLFGRFLVSLPYLNRGGVVADDHATAAQLIEKAVELAAAYDVQYLELRHSEPISHDLLPARRDEKVRMVLALPREEVASVECRVVAETGSPPATRHSPLDTSSALWKSYDPKVRNQVRKGEKAGLTIRWGGAELLDGFYDVFAVNMRDLGTPVYPKKLFASILRVVGAAAGPDVAGSTGPGAELAVVEWEAKAVAGALLVHAGPITQVPSASSLRAFSHLNANMWMYHHLLVRAVQKGAKEFDFGRSSEGSGTYRFKKQWGAQPHPTVWQYHVRHGDIGAMRPDSPRNRRRIAVWQRLPVWLTRMVGPSIVRGIP
jgi:Acetyltransferase (GNAT) domain